MRRSALAGLFLIGLGAAVPANAADIRLPVKAAPPAFVHTYYNWTGFYLGAHAGYAWADFSGTDAVLGVLAGSTTANGLIYGGQVGFNYQFGSWVLGIEGEFSFGDVKSSESLLGLATGEVKLDRIYTAAARVGYAFDRTMIYGKFGGAWTQEEYNFTLLGLTAATGSVDRSGWVLGVGVEYAFMGNWSAKLEYNYMDMGSKAVTLTTLGGLVVTPANVDLTVQTIKAGLNYRFNWGRY
jgi:outer membrane immunogenic protein